MHIYPVHTGQEGQARRDSHGACAPWREQRLADDARHARLPLKV